MAMKDRICSALTTAKTSLGCATPQVGYKARICPAINAAYTSLGCGGITPPLLKGPGESCSIGTECQSGNCNEFGLCD